MKRLSLLLAGVVGAVVLLGSSSASGANLIVNGGFETGNLTGWTATIPSGGSIDVVTVCQSCGPFSPYQPREGSRFALLKTNGPGSLTILSQAVQVSVGTIVSGWVFFFDAEAATETFFCDSASVKILVNGVAIAGAGDVFSGATCANSGNASTAWTFFQFATPVAGQLSVAASITNGGDSAFDSLLGLDGVRIDTPEPNVGRAIGAIVAGADGTRDNLARQAQVQGAAQQAAAAAAAQQAAQPTVGVLRPPSTGDAGLMGGEGSAPNRSAAIAMFALIAAFAAEGIRRFGARR